MRVVIGVGLFVVTLTWWTGGPGPYLRTPGATITSFGEITGMVGGYLVCIQVLLIASQTPWTATFAVLTSYPDMLQGGPSSFGFSHVGTC